MTTTWYLRSALLLLGALLGVASLIWWDRISPYLHPRPAPSGRDEAGADDKYGPDLDAMRRRDHELGLVASEYGLNLLDPDVCSMAEDILTLRLTVAETVDHFDGRIEKLLAEWAPGWWEDAPTTVLPSFGAVHALITDTSEFAVVA